MLNRRARVGITLGLMGVGLAVLFTNCGEPSLEKLNLTREPQLKVSGHVCVNPDDLGQAYELSSFAVVNLTAAYHGGVVYADSDVDGVPDHLEASLGFNPLKRRTDNRFLDGVCRTLGGSAQCASLTLLSCTTEVNSMGLSDCDLQALDLQRLYTHPDQGIDSDKDGLLDFIEISRGTLANTADLGGDPDGDGVTNEFEQEHGTDPRSPDFGPIQSFRFQRDDVDSCPSAAFRFDIDKFGLVGTSAFVDGDVPVDGDPPEPRQQLSFSHAKEENLILITYKTAPISQGATNAKVWGKLLKVKTSHSGNLVLEPSDFRLLGVVLK